MNVFYFLYNFSYCLYYLHPMSKLPKSVLEKFMSGDHVMRHKPGVWNGIWSDMYIESTFMCYGHDPDGIIVITLKPQSLEKWALGISPQHPSQSQCSKYG